MAADVIQYENALKEIASLPLGDHKAKRIAERVLYSVNRAREMRKGITYAADDEARD